jgi:hypothetical protein
MTAGVKEFRNDDEGYLSWVAAHSGGYVINIWPTLNPKDARLHHAACRKILGKPARVKSWTWEYIKVCSMSEVELDAWARDKVGLSIQRCGSCWRARRLAADDAPTRPVQAGSTPLPHAPRIEAIPAPAHEFQETRAICMRCRSGQSGTSRSRS